MEIRKSPGVVLASAVSGEADRIARIFTRDYGKRTFVFKGIRKSRRRPVAAAEPGSVVNLVYYHRDGRDVCVVSECSIEKQFYSIRENLDLIAHMCLVLEAVDKTSAPGDPNAGVYELLAGGIEALTKTSRLFHFSSFFLIRLLGMLGVLSVSDRCKTCQDGGLDAFLFDYSDMMPLCARCLGRSGSGRQGNLMGPAVLKFIAAASRMKFSSLDLDACPEREAGRLLYSLCMFLEHYFHASLNSKSMIFTGEI